MADYHELVRSLREKFSDVLNQERAEQIVAHVYQSLDTEWGIAYHDGEYPVDPIRKKQAAFGIFNHYGEPGDRLVSRRVTDWTDIKTK